MKNGRINPEEERIVVKCDPGCGWYTDEESISDVEEKWLNKLCPNCGLKVLIEPVDMVILKQTVKIIEGTYGGNLLYPVDTAMRRDLKETRPFDLSKEYPQKVNKE